MAPLQPHQAHHQRALRITALLGVGALALFMLLRHRQAGAYSGQDVASAAANAAQQQAMQDQVSYGTPSTFADNGAQAAELGNAVTEGLGGVSTALGSLSSLGQQTAAPPDAATLAMGAALTAAIEALGRPSGNGQHAPAGAKPGAAANGNPTRHRPHRHPGSKRQQVAHHGGAHKQNGARHSPAHHPNPPHPGRPIQHQPPPRHPGRRSTPTDRPHPAQHHPQHRPPRRHR